MDILCNPRTVLLQGMLPFQIPDPSFHPLPIDHPPATRGKAEQQQARGDPKPARFPKRGRYLHRHRNAAPGAERRANPRAIISGSLRMVESASTLTVSDFFVARSLTVISPIWGLIAVMVAAIWRKVPKAIFSAWMTAPSSLLLPRTRN